MRVAVLGTGIMGTGMAQSLLRAGHDVRVWNRTAGRAQPLAALGATVASSAPEAVEGADAVITILFDTDAVLDVMRGLSLPDGCVWLQCSTIGVEGTRRAVELAATRSMAMVDVPVLGTKAPAEQGRLVVLASGPAELLTRVEPVLEAIGAKTVHAGSRLGDGTALKLVCNAWMGTVTAGIGQSMALAAALGLDPRLFLQALDGGPADMPYLHAKSELVLADDYPPSFVVDGVVKDLGLIRDAAVAAGVDDSLLSAALGLFGRASDAGHGGKDMAAVYTAFRGR